MRKAVEESLWAHWFKRGTSGHYHDSAAVRDLLWRVAFHRSGFFLAPADHFRWVHDAEWILIHVSEGGSHGLTLSQLLDCQFAPLCAVKCYFSTTTIFVCWSHPVLLFGRPQWGRWDNRHRSKASYMTGQEKDEREWWGKRGSRGRRERGAGWGEGEGGRERERESRWFTFIHLLQRP